MGRIEFDHLGIGKALSNYRLKVSLNQREYSWQGEEVQELFEDLFRAISQGSYFLGTIVLARGAGGALEVADGQQRLATITILLAAIRDEFFRTNDTLNVQSIETEFLTVIDRAARQRIARLTLNVDDNEFFRKKILAPPDSPDRRVEPVRESHKLIDRARHLAAKHVQALVRNRSEQGRVESLLHWLEFLTQGGPGHRVDGPGPPERLQDVRNSE